MLTPLYKTSRHYGKTQTHVFETLSIFHAERVDERERDVFHVETAEREVELQVVVLVQEEHLLRLRHPFRVRLRRDCHVVCARLVDRDGKDVRASCRRVGVTQAAALPVFKMAIRHIEVDRLSGFLVEPNHLDRAVMNTELAFHSR